MERILTMTYGRIETNWIVLFVVHSVLVKGSAELQLEPAKAQCRIGSLSV